MRCADLRAMVSKNEKHSHREGVLMTEQAEPRESKETKTPGALTRWPRDLTDLWAGWAPFGAVGWPFRDIKVEEFIDGGPSGNQG